MFLNISFLCFFIVLSAPSIGHSSSFGFLNPLNPLHSKTLELISSSLSQKTTPNIYQLASDAILKADGSISADLKTSEGQNISNACLEVLNTPVYLMQGTPTLRGDTVEEWITALKDSTSSMKAKNLYTVEKVNDEMALIQTPIEIQGKTVETPVKCSFKATSKMLESTEITAEISPTQDTYTFNIAHPVIQKLVHDHTYPHSNHFILIQDGRLYDKYESTTVMRPYVEGVLGLEREVKINLLPRGLHEIEALYHLFSDHDNIPQESIPNGLYAIQIEEQIESVSLNFTENGLTLIRTIAQTLMDSSHSYTLFTYLDTHIKVETQKPPVIQGRSHLPYGVYSYDLSQNKWTHIDSDSPLTVEFFPSFIEIPLNRPDAYVYSDIHWNRAMDLSQLTYQMGRGSFAVPDDRDEFAKQHKSPMVWNAGTLDFEQIPPRSVIGNDVKRLILKGVILSDEFADQIIACPNLEVVKLLNGSSIKKEKLKSIVKKEKLKQIWITDLLSDYTPDLFDYIIPRLERRTLQQFEGSSSFETCVEAIKRGKTALIQRLLTENGLPTDHAQVFEKVQEYSTDKKNLKAALGACRIAFELSPPDKKAAYKHAQIQILKDMGKTEEAIQIARENKAHQDSLFELIMMCFTAKKPEALSEYDQLTRSQLIEFNTKFKQTNNDNKTVLLNYLIASGTLAYFKDDRYIRYGSFDPAFSLLYKDNAHYFVRKSELYEQSHKHTEALKTADIAIQINDVFTLKKALYWKARATYSLALLTKKEQDTEKYNNYVELFKQTSNKIITSTRFISYTEKRMRGEIANYYGIAISWFGIPGNKTEIYKISMDLGNDAGTSNYAYHIYDTDKAQAYNLVKNLNVKGHWANVIIAELCLSGEVNTCPKNLRQSKRNALTGVKCGNEGIQSRCRAVMKEINRLDKSIVSDAEVAGY